MPSSSVFIRVYPWLVFKSLPFACGLAASAVSLRSAVAGLARLVPAVIALWQGFWGGGRVGLMKTKRKQSSHSSPAPEPMMEEDPFYGHAEWVEPELKQTVAQEARRMSQHSGKTIRRPKSVARTMGT